VLTVPDRHCEVPMALDLLVLLCFALMLVAAYLLALGLGRI
jgi:hypothetical protein